MYLRNDSARSASAREIRERDLGFDHPELGEVAAGVAVLRAERRPECVDLRERETVGLDVELTADGQERFLPEEVFREISAPFLRLRDHGEVRKIQRADAEHLARAFGVACRHDRCVHPEEAVLVKVAMDRHAEAVTHTRHRTERVRPRPEVRYFTEILERRLLLLDWVRFRVVNPADDVDALGLQLDGLPLTLTGCQHTCRRERTSRGELLDLALVIGQRV